MTDTTRLATTIDRLVQPGQGILAADESNRTATKRLNSVDVESTEETRRQYRELLFSTQGLGEFISGVILYEETLYQNDEQGTPLPRLLENQNIVPGIKVDKGLVGLANSQDEKITQGLDGLADRLAQYKEQNARFTKWRSVFNADNGRPSHQAKSANSEVLGRYAALAQTQGFVPIVEPEVLIDGEHSHEQCQSVTEAVLRDVFTALTRHKVSLEYIILKPSMVISGKNNGQQSTVEQVAQDTLTTLKRTVPAAVPSINFLSGGQTPEQATAHLNTMNQFGPQPWNISFSYARALQDPCLKTWRGDDNNAGAAQDALYRRAYLNSLAGLGQYNKQMENQTVTT